MKKKILIISISILLISSFCFVVFSKNKEKMSVNKLEGYSDGTSVQKNISIGTSTRENVDHNTIETTRFDKIVMPIKSDKIEPVAKKDNKDVQKIENINSKDIIDKFKSPDLNNNVINKNQKIFIKDDINNFVQISNKDIVRGEILNNQCILNIVYNKSELSVCDFVRNECSDLGCKNFDCLEYKNNWFKISYYGDFVGSGDKELIYRNENEIVIANLECDDKTKEGYDNPLFVDLVE